MRDLYGRAGLQKYESDRDRIREARASDRSVQQDVKFVLLNGKRKNVYDRVYQTLDSIGYVESHLKLPNSRWDRQYPDFMPEEDNAEWAGNTRRPSKECRGIYPKSIFLGAAILFMAAVIPSGNETSRPPAQKETTEALFQPSTLASSTREIETVIPVWRDGYVKANVLNVRSEPSRSGPVLGQLQQYDDIEYKEVDGNQDWVEVRNKGQFIGYVASMYIGRVPGGEGAMLQACRAEGGC